MIFLGKILSCLTSHDARKIININRKIDNCFEIFLIIRNYLEFIRISFELNSYSFFHSIQFFFLTVYPGRKRSFYLKVTWTSEATFAMKNEDDISLKNRGHSMKLTREIVKSCEQRHNFYTNRVCNAWNALSIKVVQGPSINSFKSSVYKVLFLSYNFQFYFV